MRPIHALAIAVVITAILILLIAGRLYTSNAEYNLGNPYPDGYSTFYAGRDVSHVHHLSDLPSGNASGTALLVVSPQYRYRTGDVSEIKSYMANGGTLIVIDDSGESGSLLNLLNSPIRMLPGSLYQKDKYGNSIASPVISNVSGTGMTGGVSQIYTDHPAALNVSNSTTVFASASGQGWVYKGNDGIEVLANNNVTYPIIAAKQFGNGSLVVISDPGIFANGMIGKGDNNKLAANIFAGNKIYLDLTHSPGTPMLTSAVDKVINDRKVQLLLIAAILLLCLIGFIVIRSIYESLGRETEDSTRGNYE